MATLKHSLIRLVATAAVLFSLATLGPAPIRGDKYGITPHDNLQKQDEKTLESEQNPVVAGQVGAVSAPKAEVQMEVNTDSEQASNVFNAAHRSDSTGAAANSDQVIAAASARLEPQANHAWIWAALAVVAVVGGVLGVKRWADQNVPNMPTVTTKREGW